MKIVIETIAHDQQRYETPGDWRFDEKGDLQIRVSDLADWRMEALVGLHEAVEALLCKSDGVTQEQVDQFDMAFEDARKAVPHEREPGDDLNAPYADQHRIATGIESMVALALGVRWQTYAKQVDGLRKT